MKLLMHSLDWELFKLCKLVVLYVSFGLAFSTNYSCKHIILHILIILLVLIQSFSSVILWHCLIRNISWISLKSHYTSLCYITMLKPLSKYIYLEDFCRLFSSFNVMKRF